MPPGLSQDDEGVDLYAEAWKLDPEAFTRMAELVYGDAAWEIVAKLDAQERKHQKTQARVALASNALGITAGIGGTVTATRQFRHLKNNPKKIEAPITRKAFGYLRKVPPKKLLVGGLAGGVALQGANVAGDFVANRVLARENKRVNKRLLSKVNTGVTWRGEISKRDDDKRQVFGWASVVEVDGKPVVDHQEDMIPVDEIEKAAYSYVLSSRKGGDMHRKNGDEPHHVSNLIESFLVTPEKKEKMGLPDSMPIGWWVGFQVHDDNTWDLVKSGQRTEFSIHGAGRRVEKVLED